MTHSHPAPHYPDEELDAAARGYFPDEADDGDDENRDENWDEIAAMGEAAGIPIPDGKPLGDVDPIERRDTHRWEFVPDSAEDADAPELDGSHRNARG